MIERLRAAMRGSSRAMSASRMTIVAVRPMTPDEREAFEIAFAKMDEAFAVMDKVLKR